MYGCTPLTTLLSLFHYENFLDQALNKILSTTNFTEHIRVALLIYIKSSHANKIKLKHGLQSELTAILTKKP